MLYTIRLKTGLFEVKLYYINFMRLFYQESQVIWRHEEHVVMQRKPWRRISNFSRDFRCSKTIFTFLLQIIWSEWLLTFVLNVKNCFNAKKEIFLSVYLLITEIYTYWSYGDGIALPRTRKSNSSEMKIHVLCSLSFSCTRLLWWLMMQLGMTLVWLYVNMSTSKDCS